MSDGRELESRVERLETALREIDARLASLEHRPVSGGQASLPVLSPPSAVVEESSLGLFGVCILILGGAFVLRALTESSLLPRIVGAVLGLIYAAAWMWNADRLARRHRTQAASFHAVTAAVIAFPLVWETTIRFAVMPAVVASILLGAFGVAFLWTAVRNQQQLLAWIGTVAATIAAFAIGPSPIILVVVAAIGVATSIGARQWEFASWPAALASNIIALIVIFTRPAGTAAALIVFTVLWAATAAVRRKPSEVSAVVQATVAILIGIGGTTLLLLPSAATASLVWSLLAVTTAELARRTHSRALSIQSVVWILAASVAGGLLLATVGAFTGDAASVELPPEALACGSAAIFGFLRLPGGAEKIVMLSIFLCMTFTGVLTIVLPSFSSALLRTAVLAIFASLLAIVGRLMENRVASILARAVLVVGGLKLLAEDLRVGSAAILVISFACYGLALLIVARSGWAAGRRESGVTTITT